MSEADDVIAALRSEHDAVVRLAARLSDADLARTSGASEWTVGRVLSHLGSGSQIQLPALITALAVAEGREPPAPVPPQEIWARWDSLDDRAAAEAFVAPEEAFVSAYEALSPDQREGLRIDLGFIPVPVPVSTAARVRLSELALHSWDVRVPLDPTTTLSESTSAALLLGEPDLISWVGKPAPLAGRSFVVHVVTEGPSESFTLHLGEPVRVTREPVSSYDATLRLPAESWLRLVAGRLGPDHTPASVEISGAVDLDLLRRVFPGY